MTPTKPSIQSNNYYAVLTDFDDDDVDTHTPPPPDNCDHTASEQTPALPKESPTALCDSGATSHFITDDVTHVLNKQTATNPITITLPDGATLRSTHTCELDIPTLRSSARQAHIVPGLAHTSLLSTAKFCDAGYTVTFDATSCQVRDGPTVVLQGQRDPSTTLWSLPLSTTTHFVSPKPTIIKHSPVRMQCPHHSTLTKSSQVHAPSSVLPSTSNTLTGSQPRLLG